MRFTKFRLGVAVVAFAVVAPAVAVAVSPFVDVVPGRFYEASVDWAFGNGITTGRDATHFDPDGAVTRGESVTFLKRYNDNVVEPMFAGLGSTLGGLSCGAGQVAKFDGANWACGADADTTVPNTDVMASLGCTADQVARWDGSAWVCNTVGLSSVVGVNSATSVDTLGNLGAYGSVAIGSDLLPIVSYYDSSNTSLKVFHCADPGCTSGTATTLDNTGSVGRFSSIAVGTNGMAVISYNDATNGTLKVFHCADIACTTGIARMLDNFTTDVGRFSSITIGADGFPLISYYDGIAGSVRLYHCTAADCSTGGSASQGPLGFVGQYTSIAIGADGFGIISYWDPSSTGDLRVFHCTTTACTGGASTVVETTPGNVGKFTSIAIGTDGLAIISHYDATNKDLRVFHCADTACTSGTGTAVDTGGDVGQYTSIAIGADGMPMISYFDATNLDLKVFHCADTACTGGTATTLDSSGNVGAYTSLAIGADNEPIVSYQDVTSLDLKVGRLTLSVTGVAFG